MLCAQYADVRGQPEGLLGVLGHQLKEAWRQSGCNAGGGVRVAFGRLHVSLPGSCCTLT